MWTAYLDAIDLAPPLNTMLTRAIHLLVGEGPIATRLPAMVGFVVAGLVLFAFVRRRSNVLMGFTAAVMPTATVAWHYAQEARGYGLTMACFACALYGWSEAAAGRRAGAHLALMSVAMAAGMWAHYYFALALVPISIAEAVRQGSLRRFEYRPWLAITAACVAALPLLPLAAVASEQRTTFWAHSTTLEFGNTYAFILGPLTEGGPRHRLVAFAGLALTAAAAIATHVFRLNSSSRRLETHDLVLCLLCLLVPAGGVLLGSWVGAFHYRYVVYAIVGLVAAVPLLLWSASPTNRVVESLALLISLVFAISVALGPAKRNPSRDPLSARSLLTDLAARGQDVVVTGGIQYLPIWYYLPPEAQPRVKYLADRDGELKTTGSDSIDRGYLALSRWTRVTVVPIGEFGQTDRHFFLYAPGDNERWAEERIRSWSPSITYVGRHHRGRLYEIDMRPK